MRESRTYGSVRGGYRKVSVYSIAEDEYEFINVDEDYRRQGIGSLLYREPEKMLRKQGIVNLLK